MRLSTGAAGVLLSAALALCAAGPGWAVALRSDAHKCCNPQQAKAGADADHCCLRAPVPDRPASDFSLIVVGLAAPVVAAPPPTFLAPAEAPTVLARPPSPPGSAGPRAPPTA